ncbi:MAG: N-acetylmuramoyl-L-alanine amidase [Paludibacteraceae bacterium]|jgi:N-acetylmuramoyl-L-alanine amidase|nr:N-acetylmuramoyl-L-alanine amidase [Paludibacteraceae bacterium]
MRKINEIIVHCTATFPEQVVTVADINRWHRQRGFNEIGYHFLVNQQGQVAAGRAIEKAGAHCQGHNANSIGVCYVGGLDLNGKPADTRTDEQKTALRELLRSLKEQFPNATIHGHNEFAAKACPCFDATSEYASL